MLIYGNLREEVMSHCDNVVTSYHTCISHSMMQQCMLQSIMGLMEVLVSVTIAVIWSIICAKFIYFLFSLQISYALQFSSVELLITEHVIRLATILNTNMKYKLISIEESWILLTWWMLLKIFLSRKWCKSFAFLSPLKYKTQHKSRSGKLSWRKVKTAKYYNRCM